MYKCECGCEFEKRQSLIAHKGHCKIHLGEERYNKCKESYRNNVLKGTEASAINRKIEAEEKLSKWISEQHTCEYCGKIMTEYYGSGRFCCEHCARAWVSNNRSEDAIRRATEYARTVRYFGYNSLTLEQRREIRKESDIKRREKYNGRYFSSNVKRRKRSIEERKIMSQNKKKYYKDHPEYFSKLSSSIKKAIENGARPGYLSTGPDNSYPEKVISIILDKLGIIYSRNYSVTKSKLGCNTGGSYRLDFYIPNGKIDLEVDGSMHGYDPYKTSDHIRNTYLTENGYNVFRIKWYSGTKYNDTLGKDILEFKEWYKNIIETGARGLLRTYEI